MRRKRKRNRRRSLSGAALLSAPRRRRRSHSLMTAPRRRKRRRGLSEMNLVKGKYGSLINPGIEGSIGGVVAQGATKIIPASILTSPSIAPHEKLVKRGFGYGLALLAAYMKQPLVAAGIAGGTTVLLLQDENVLQDEGPAGNFSARGRFRQGRFADSRLLSERRLLSEGESIYAPYQNQMLTERPSDEFRY